MAEVQALKELRSDPTTTAISDSNTEKMLSILNQFAKENAISSQLICQRSKNCTRLLSS